ncbi:hypothetical protein, partial [Halorubrum ejinorense]|uniref:hypothetical protein n=1 Tax=Halorubrum ejinorense TaxID=425309 RepID=UPI0036061C49
GAGGASDEALEAFGTDPQSTIYTRAAGASAVFTPVATRRDLATVSDSSRPVTLSISASRPKRW